MKIAPNLNFTVVEPTKNSLDKFVQMIKNVYQNFSQAFNGQIGFGDGTNLDNINGSWINVTAPAVANTDFTVNHNMNRIPSGYWVMQKDRACDVYTGSVAATSTQLTLRASVASAVLRLFIICLLLSLTTISVYAQNTSVSGAVTDGGGQTWNNGTYQFNFFPSPTFNGVYRQNGNPFTPTVVSGSLSATGTFTSVSVPDNGQITPSGTKWTITVCTQTNFVCFTSLPIVITGSTQTITGNINPPAILVTCGPGVNAYADVEVSCGIGGSYYNLTSQVSRTCQAVTGNVCTTWIGGGGGGGTVTTTGTPTNGNIAKFSSATAITNGDLSGDVTTAGTLATTVSKINGTSLAGLATGILKNTTTTGVPSIAVAGDFPTLNQNTTGTAAGLSLPSGTAAMGTTAIASGACATVVTVAAAGLTTATGVFNTSFNGDPTAVTGYGASATGAVLTIYPYPTAGNVNFKVCNSTASSITPGALTLNWQVTHL